MPTRAAWMVTIVSALSTNEVRTFRDDDFRAAVRLLEAFDMNLEFALSYIKLVRTSSVNKEQLLAMAAVADRLECDCEAMVQLLIVTDSFRDVLGLKSSA